MADKDFQINVKTTADTAGIKQTEAELAALKAKQDALFARVPPGGPAAPAAPAADQQAALRNAEQSANIVGQLIGRLVGAGAIYGLINNIGEVANQLKQISKELDNQGNQLVANAEKYTEQARSATSEADVLKIASSALKDVEKAHRSVIETQGEELTTYQKITDSIYHLLQNVQAYGHASADAGKISKQALDLTLEGLRQLEAIADQNSRAAIRTGKAYEEAFERRKAEPFIQAVSEINKEIEDLKIKQNQLDPRTKDYVKDWINAGNAIANAQKQLYELTKLERDRERAAKERAKAEADAQAFIDKAASTASPQAKAILANQEAAKQARAQGRGNDADLFDKTAEALKRGATPDQLAEVEGLTKAQSGGPVGRKAGVGESQEAVDAIERNRKAFEKQQYDTGTGGPSFKTSTPRTQLDGPQAGAKQSSPDVVAAIKESTGVMRQLIQQWS